MTYTVCTVGPLVLLNTHRKSYMSPAPPHLTLIHFEGQIQGNSYVTNARPYISDSSRMTED